MNRLEKILLWTVAIAAVAAVGGPAVAQQAHYHGFADQRAWAGLPNALDVLSNLPFAVGGLWGLLVLKHQPPGVQRGLAALFFAGLLLAALCSGIYHWQPDNVRLALDRAGMVPVFAGLLGLAVADRSSDRAGLWTAGAVLLWGPLSVAVWSATGNLLPWAVLQGGGMLLVLGLALCPPRPGAWGIRLGGVIAAYALAKWLEQGDHSVFAWTGGVVSGHSLKHAVAALAAWPVLAVMASRTAKHKGARVLRAAP
nr:hypothetical protein [uncultured Albidiferax sp.]